MGGRVRSSPRGRGGMLSILRRNASGSGSDTMNASIWPLRSAALRTTGPSRSVLVDPNRGTLGRAADDRVGTCQCSSLSLQTGQEPSCRLQLASCVFDDMLRG